MLFHARHIQNYSNAASLEPHWGYVARVLPCTNDAGSCAYLDVVYHSHDLGMIYVGIIWASIIAVLFIWIMLRSFLSSTSSPRSLSTSDRAKAEPVPLVRKSMSRLFAATKSALRRRLLPDAFRPLFGRTTRLQVLIFSIILAYLCVWSFIGIRYSHWITPVKQKPNVYNTRSSLGPWADRIGVLAFGLTPLSILLSSRESILSLITGVPHHHFNFLHRWLGYIILIQGIFHTLGWTIVEAKLYQPQPQTAREWISETYMIWGCVAILLLVLLWLFSLPIIIRRTGYEFFRKAHYILAILFIGACWGHWAQLRCFLIPSLAIWFLDRTVRLMRTFLLHYNILSDGSMAFRPSQAQIKVFIDEEGDKVVRLDIDQQQQPWQIGQHFYLCFTESSIWQSHPFTPLSLPINNVSGLVRHSYIFRAKSGETSKVADLALQKIQSAQCPPTTGVLLTGPYGRSVLESLEQNSNVFCIAGGSGITYVLPVLLYISRFWPASGGNVSLIWIVRHKSDVMWVQPELDEIMKSARVSVSVLSTRDETTTTKLKPTSHEDLLLEESKGESKAHCDLEESIVRRRPNLNIMVKQFVEETSSGSTTIVASGPGSMVSDLQRIVANCNSGRSVWANNLQADVELVYDDRLEW